MDCIPSQYPNALELSHAGQYYQHYGNAAATQLRWDPWRYQFQALIPQTWFLLTPVAISCTWTFSFHGRHPFSKAQLTS